MPATSSLHESSEDLPMLKATQDCVCEAVAKACWQRPLAFCKPVAQHAQCGTKHAVSRRKLCRVIAVKLRQVRIRSPQVASVGVLSPPKRAVADDNKVTKLVVNLHDCRARCQRRRHFRRFCYPVARFHCFARPPASRASTPCFA